MHGLLVIDKPEGITSFGVVKEVRHALGVKKAGHTGTLDPMATGVLPVCLGEATKIAGMLLAEDKAYEAEILLGQETDTLDITGEVTAQEEPAGITEQALEAALATFLGEQEQVPPAYSAVRVGGKRAHELARQGRAPELKPRQITFHELKLISFEPPRARLQVACSKGTYIRTLISDLGRLLGCGACMSGLRRTASGAFSLEQAIPLAQVKDRLEAGDLPLFSLDVALNHLPALDVDEQGAQHLRHGQPLPPGDPPPEETLIRVRLDGEVIALGEARMGQVWPKRVFQL